jgi:hypothetical protein
LPPRHVQAFRFLFQNVGEVRFFNAAMSAASSDTARIVGIVIVSGHGLPFLQMKNSGRRWPGVVD